MFHGHRIGIRPDAPLIAPAAFALNLLSGALDSRVAFTRSTTGTRINASGLIESVAIDGPRFDYDPVTLAPLGLLIEEQRTNLLLRASEFGDALWAKSSISVVSDATSAPDGSSTAVTISGSAANAFVWQNVALTAASYAYSVYVKAGTATSVRVNVYDNADHYVVFDLTTGTSSSQVNVSGYAAQQCGNGWWRLWIIWTAAAIGSQIRVLLPAAGTVHVWGAQLEAGAFPTSYIPTTTAQVTRTADNFSITGTNFSSWYNASEGTLLVDMAFIASAINPNAGIDLRSDNSNYVTVRATTGFVQTSAGTQALFVAGVANTTPKKRAIAYKANDFAYSYDGGAVLTDTAGAVPVMNTLRLDVANGSISSNAHIRSLSYFNTRKSNAELQAMTA